MGARVQNILIKICTLLIFVLLNFIGLKAFSATEIPSCELASEGYVQDQWKSIRIQVNDAVVAGAETLSDLAQQLKQLIVENKCLPSPAPCSFAAEGPAIGAWAKHRIVVNDVAAFGANTTARVFEQLGQLKKMGVCE